MEVRAIRSEADYRAALALVSKLVDLDPAPDTADGERLEVIGTLVQAYEAQHYPISPPDPIEAIKLRMEQDGLRGLSIILFVATDSQVLPRISRTRRCPAIQPSAHDGGLWQQ